MSKKFLDESLTPDYSVEKQSTGYSEILLSAKNSKDLLNRLFDAGRAKSKAFSLAYVAQKSGIKSRGYLSNVLKGHRILHPKYRPILADFFGYKGLEYEYFLALFEVDEEQDQDKLMVLLKKRTNLLRTLKIQKGKIPDFRGTFFACEVYCAFSLFQNRPTLEQLQQFFGRSRSMEVMQALKVLSGAGMVRRQEDGCFVCASDTFLFIGSDDGMSHIDFLKHSFKDAMEKAEANYLNLETAMVSSEIVSVNRKKYLEFVQEFRKRYFELVTDLNSEDADLLVRLNVSFYPLEYK